MTESHTASGGAVPAGGLPFPAHAGLFAVGLASLALGLGGPVPVVVWAALAVFWRKKAVGLMAMFLFALALAVAAAPAGTAAPKEVAAPAVARTPSAPAASIGAVDPRKPLDAEGVWRYGIPKATSGESVRMASTVVDTAPTAPTPTAPVATSTTSPTATNSTPPPASKGTYKIVAVANGGTLRGTCTLTGAPAAFQRVQHDKDLDKGCGPAESPSERVAAGEGNALSNCVVYLAAIREGKDFPPELAVKDRTFVIDQKGCFYRPHVGAFRVGTQLVIDNSDSADHNIHLFFDSAQNNLFNSASAPGKRIDDLEKAFIDKVGKYPVKCDIHPWMNAYLHVFPHPYFDVTSVKGSDGRKPGEFVLADVPPGPYELVCWHEGMISTPIVIGGLIKGYEYTPDIVDTKQVTVAAGANPPVDFAVPYK